MVPAPVIALVVSVALLASIYAFPAKTYILNPAVAAAVSSEII